MYIGAVHPTRVPVLSVCFPLFPCKFGAHASAFGASAAARRFSLGILLVGMAFPNLRAQCQPLNTSLQEFEILARGQEIGFLKARKIQFADSVRYEIYSESAIRLVISYQMAFRQVAVYRAGRMVRSSLVHYVNHKRREHHRLRWVDARNHYRVQSSERKAPVFIAEPIYEGTASIYFRKPRKKRLYALRHQQWLTIRPQERKPEYYELFLPNGKVNGYHYDRNGGLKEVEVDNMMMKVLIRAK